MLAFPVPCAASRRSPTRSGCRRSSLASKEIMGSQERAAGAGAPRRKAIQIPGFEVEAEIGRGGMGIVYRARQTSIGRQVAVKVLPSAATKNPTFVERFLREAKAAAKLNHENVVSAIDAGRSGDVVYFVMEFIDGQT